MSHMAEQFSWVPLSYCSPPGHLFPIKSLALSAHVSPQTIHFQVLDNSPLSGPGRGPPSCYSLVFLLVLLPCAIWCTCSLWVCPSPQLEQSLSLYILFQVLFQYRLLQNIEYSSMCYILWHCWLSNLYLLVCICLSQTPNLPLLSFPFGNHKFVFYVCECVSVRWGLEDPVDNL
jgi:hypothetical protein